MDQSNSKLALAIVWAKTYVKSYRFARRTRADFKSIRTFCCFIGYPRSGHSLVEALIDAHPNATISHEINVIRYMQLGFSRSQLYALILQRSRRFAETGSTRGGYDYLVPDQWQGRYRELHLIGDKKGAGLSHALGHNPRLLEKLKIRLGVPIRVIHSIRNPYDNIASIYIRKRNRGEADFNVVDRYFSLCAQVQKIRRHLGPEELMEIRHEDLVAQPVDTLSKICTFLELEPFPDYLRSCAGIIWPKALQNRYEYPWAESQIDHVAQKIREFPFLEGYTFEG